MGGQEGVDLQYKRLGKTLGFGSFHFSRNTVDEIESLLAQEQNGRRVSSIFGEGVNPRMRKIRSGLDLVGFPSDLFLKHGSPRIVYGVALASNSSDVLLGKTTRPKYIIPQHSPADVTRRIGDYWIQRWLSKRIDREGVLEAVEGHTLVHPIRHGARVPLPEIEEEESLFADLE